MSLFQSIIMGLVQGLTEFLPISSSAHLTLVPWFLGWPDPGLAFDVALHWGTLIAVTVYYIKDIKKLIIGTIGSFQGQRSIENKIPWMIVVATIPGVIAGLLLEEKAESVFRSPPLIAGALSVMAIFLFIGDRFWSGKTPFSEIKWGQALVIGFFQAFALIPGVSRSGITMTTGLFAGLSREACVKFSFLLAIPITAGAGILKFEYIVQNAKDPFIWVGILTSACAGLLAIHVLTKLVKTRSFFPFVVYRLVLAGAIGARLWLG